MQIVVAASDAQWTELTNNRTGVEWIRVPDDAAFAAYPGADCFSISWGKKPSPDMPT